MTGIDIMRDILTACKSLGSTIRRASASWSRSLNARCRTDAIRSYRAGRLRSPAVHREWAQSATAAQAPSLLTRPPSRWLPPLVARDLGKSPSRTAYRRLGSGRIGSSVPRRGAVAWSATCVG